MDKYKQLPLINGVEVQAYRDTGASVTMVIEKLVHPDQHLLGHQYQVTDAHNNTLSYTMAVVNLIWGGEDTGPKKVVVASDLPVDSLLGNDLETSAWAEVELEAHAAMLGIPGHIFALTRAQAKKQKGQGNLDPGTMDQVLPKARGSKGKSLPTIPSSTDDSPSEEEEFPPSAEPSSDELAADTAELLGGGGLPGKRADLTLLMATDEGQEEESDTLFDLFSSTEEDALVDGVVLADCLIAEQKDNCINLLGQFSELFSTVPGTTSWCEHTINTGGSMPVKSKIYRQPDHVRDCIKQAVQKMLALGVVEPSESP
ncbi:hypothetical protein NDU88_000902 [Pleurodeles waltl]|uniref:Peptidase A2 domain-containing protein n=1 Tax=Pleurodeles waltl TaxID=8319 RepID=A0AAV7LW26_PLEWA|nr:hypothetical protein NDU88_000902 [Pleurodeles waltl]